MFYYMSGIEPYVVVGEIGCILCAPIWLHVLDNPRNFVAYILGILLGLRFGLKHFGNVLLRMNSSEHATFAWF